MMKKSNNAGKYKKKIKIILLHERLDAAGFNQEPRKEVVWKGYAQVITTKGFTIIANNSDFSKAFTNFTIRFPKQKITREMLIEYDDRYFSIEYLSNIDEMNLELEIQTKEIVK